jgi:hypothetical protein
MRKATHIDTDEGVAAGKGHRAAGEDEGDNLEQEEGRVRGERRESKLKFEWDRESVAAAPRYSRWR